VSLVCRWLCLTFSSIHRQPATITHQISLFQQTTTFTMPPRSQPVDNTPVHNPDDLAIPSYTVPPLSSEAKTTNQRSPCCRRLICIATVLGIAVAAAVGIMIALTGDQGPQAIFIQEDPPGVEDTNRWTANRGQGLELFVMNSCEDRWTPIFDEYIQRWDNGQPDALTLTSRKFPHDPECAEYTGRVNVCNGNYGNTEWRGVNTAFLQGGFVRHSVAKLNDYHLDRESQNQKRYTMCHELGKFSKVTNCPDRATFMGARFVAVFRST